MKTKIKKINSFTVLMSVNVKWDDIKEEYNNEFMEYSKGYSIPGFRKGKVPFDIVKKNIGPSVEAAFSEKSIGTYYKRAMEEHKLIPINQGSIKELSFSEGKDLHFSIEFEVNPDIKLPKYSKKYKIETIKLLATDSDVDRAINDIQEKHSTIKKIDTGAESGHFIMADFQEIDSAGLPVIGKKHENQYIRLGTGNFTGESENQLLGLKEGDSTRIDIDVEGTKVTHQIDIKKVEEQMLPELDAKFVKSIDPDTKSVKEFKKKVKENIQNNLDAEHEKGINNRIIDYFVKNSKIDAPKSMVDRYMNHLIEDYKKGNKSVADSDIEKIRSQYSSIAEHNVKWYLIKAELVREESVETNRDEVDSEIEKAISQSPKMENEIKEFYKDENNWENLYNDLLQRKLFSELKKYMNHKVIEKTTDSIKQEEK